MNSDNEYVSKSELRNAFKSVTGDSTCPLHIAATIDQILDFVPSADVVKVKHARWMLDHMTGDWSYYSALYLSVSIKNLMVVDADAWRERTPRYCPNCGALMDLKEETEFGTAL